jgi:hypothetical protein
LWSTTRPARCSRWSEAPEVAPAYHPRLLRRQRGVMTGVR